MGTIARMSVELGMDASGFDRGLASVQKSLDSVSKKMASAGSMLSLGVTAPIAGIATMAIQSAGDFEQSLNIMQQVSGATESQMASLQAQALQLGAETSFSAGEAAAAMLELGKAGLSVEQVGAAIGGTMDLAAAGGLELAQAAEITANAVNTFGLDASAATGVANTFAAAANASSAEVGDLAAGFQMAGAVFASNGQSVDDLAASMAILANNGIAGSDAGTSLKTMMMRLAAPTGEAAAAMANLGINVYNSDGTMRDFETIVGSLSTATSGLTDAQRNMAFTTIFGADAIRAATVLADAGSLGFADMATAVGKQGAAADVANARMKGFGGAMEYLKGSVDSFLISTALPFLDSMSGIVRTVADAITGLGGLPAPLQNAALAFAGVMAAAGPVMLALAGVATVLGFLLSPIGLVVVSVAVLAAAWAANFGGIQEKTAAVWAAIQPTLQILADWFQAALPAATTTGTAAITALWDQLLVLGAGLATFFAPAIERLQTAFVGLPEALAPMLPKLQEMAAAFGGMLTAVQPLIFALGVALVVAANFGVNLMAAAMERLPGIVGPIIDQVTNTVRIISTVLTEVTAAILAIASGDWSAAWESMKSIVTAFQTFVSETWTNITTMVGNVGGAVGEAVVKTLEDMGLTAAAQAVKDIIANVKEMGDSLTSVLSGDLAFSITLPDWLSKLLKWAWPAIPAVPSWITTLLSWAWPKMPSVPNWIQQLFNWRWPGLPEAPSWLADLLNWSWPAMPAFPNLNPFGGGQADGGSVSARTTYLVGERGPELFTPNKSGTIIPNDELGGLWGDMVGAGEGGPQVTVYATVANQIDVHAMAYQVAAEIDRWRRR